MAQNKNCERLFLLEILVENLTILKSALSTDVEDGLQNFAISVKFGSLPCFELCLTNGKGIFEDDERGLLIKYLWNKGKNCIFPMKPSALATLIQESRLILVLRQNLASEDTSELTTGKTEVNYYFTLKFNFCFQISLGEDMLKMVCENERWLSDEPISEKIRDTFTFTGMENSFVGTVQLVVRLMCLGATVLTNIQLTSDLKFKFNKDNCITHHFDYDCKSCAPGKTVSCANSNPKNFLNQKSLSEYVNVSSTSSNNFSPKIHPVPCHSTPKRNCLKQSMMQNTVLKRRNRLLALRRRNDPLRGHRHDACKALEKLVPARHGWAWTHTAPIGVKLSDIQGWKPGYFRKCYLRSLEKKPKENFFYNLKGKQEKGARKRREMDVVPTVRLVRGNGHCRITYAPCGSKQPEHYDYSVPSDDSEIELAVAMPKPLPRPPQLRHQAQQFCSQDFAILPKPKVTKSKTKQKKNVVAKKTKSEKVVVKPKPWDDWILKIDCKSDLKNWKTIVPKKSKKDGKRKEIKRAQNV